MFLVPSFLKEDEEDEDEVEDEDGVMEGFNTLGFVFLF
jgi:hypothetical protein